MTRIGVFVCHCGENIAATVDVLEVARAAGNIPGVAYSTDYKYMCSDPGQNLVREAIREHKLTGVVVSSCSPRMHEPTFRKACAAEGLNPFMCELANIREHCSWVHPHKEEGTEKAIDTVRILVEKVKRNTELTEIQVPVTKRALVIGGGIAGIQAALDIANTGHEVVMVEKSPSIGGHMAQLSETFPTLDCSQCIMTPRMVELYQHPRIKLYVYAEVEEVNGFIGNFSVKIKQKAKSVIDKLCTGCGACTKVCPVKKVSSEFDTGLGKRTAIYSPFPQAVPNRPAIDRATCSRFKSSAKKGTDPVTSKVCGKCFDECPIQPEKAIDFGQKDEIVTEEIGAIVMATGFEVMEVSEFPEYGYGKYPDIITGLQFERLASASGPTGGEIQRPSDGKVPKDIVFIQCAGSRDNAKGISYCSKICCMYTAKHAMLFKHKVHDGMAYVFYMDIRAGGKNYDEFTRRSIEQDGAVYLRGRVSKIYREGEKLIVKGVDTLAGEPVEIEADMVVLATAIKAPPGIKALAQKLGISYDKYNFMSELHPKLRPVETSSAGVYLAGACQAPKDIPEAVSQASAAAVKVAGLFSNDLYEREPVVAEVDEQSCVACYYCLEVCPYGAIEEKEIMDRNGNPVKRVAYVNKAVCQGCGACVATCRSNSIDLAGFSDIQMAASIDAIWEEE
ncbi:4Fe-4S binding protein [Fibrobacterota bacterium]